MKRLHSRKKNSVKIFAAAAVVAAAFFAISTFVFSDNKDSVIAEVNNQKIYKAEVEAKLRNVFEGQNFGNSADVKIPEIATLPKEVIEILAKEIYLERELTKEAQKSKAAKSKELKEKIAETKDRMIRQAYVNSLLKQQVTDEKIQAKYAELSDDLKGKKEYALSHIVSKSKEDAEKIAKELNGKNSTKFSELAKKYSLDVESSTRGGSIGYVVESNMIKEIADILPTLKKDQVSQPIQTKFGWHLIKITDIRDAQPLAFENVKDNIREQLSQDALNEINSKITKDAKIKILVKLEEPKAASTEEKADDKANAIAAPQEQETTAVTEEEKSEKVEEQKTEEKTEEKSEKKAKHEDKKQQHKQSKKHKK